MQINGIDLKKLKLEDLHFLIKKYKIGDYNHPPNNWQDSYKLIKRYAIQKIKKYKITKGAKVRKLSAPMNIAGSRINGGPKAPPFRDRRMSAPGTAIEVRQSIVDSQKGKHKVSSNPPGPSGDLLK